MKVGEVAYVRSGDKGDVLNLSCIPIDPADFGWLAATVTAERVADLYALVMEGDVTRYELPGISAFNFVVTRTLGGGVSRSLGIDPHGKAWGTLLQALEIGDRPARATPRDTGG